VTLWFQLRDNSNDFRWLKRRREAHLSLTSGNCYCRFLLDTRFFKRKTTLNEKCPYCGKEYPNEASACAIDGQPLATFPPEPTPTDAGSYNEVKNVVIHTFINHEAAQLAASNLEAHGIECWVGADDCSGMYPNLTAASGVRLSVAASDAGAAVALLNAQASPVEIKQVETEAVASSSPEPVSEKPPKSNRMLFGTVIGVILGVILCLFYQWVNGLGTKTHYRYSHGKPNEEWVYRDGHLVEFLEDRNLDGKWDHWTYYEHGRAVRSEYDNNFDGKPDSWWTFSDDENDTLQEDTDFNGIPDVFFTYKNRIIQEMEIRPNGSKYAITREIYQNGVLTEIDRGGDSNGNFKEKVRYDPFFNPIGTSPINTNSATPFQLLLPASK
jgi:hypothetical protein